MPPIITVENLSKKYIISHEGREKYTALRDVIAGKVKSVWKSISSPFFPNSNFHEPTSLASPEEFWALKDVSFEVNQGDRIGIIGRNGAGKSTLLKILSRITEPTQGKISIRGRVASLLEVGTGFHPELTGRENIFLNGVILGMTRAEIQKKFDEVVEFAEVEKFLDTPVKHYSSGMYVRLAFAVAAHLEPEILVVDEVLAVGDAEFQKKCLGKMEYVSKRQGRTVLFVSHNMGAIKTLCAKGLCLKKGSSIGVKTIESAISEYTLQGCGSSSNSPLPLTIAEITVYSFVISQKEIETKEFDGDYSIEVKLEFEICCDLTDFRIGFFIKTPSGDPLMRSLLADWNSELAYLKKGRYLICNHIPARFFTAGNYLIEVHGSRYGIKDYCLNEYIFKQFSVTMPSNFNQNYSGEKVWGIVVNNSPWRLFKN